jgi:hypothetical protein
MLSAARSKSLFNHFSFQVIENGGAHDFGDLVGQDVGAMMVVALPIRIDKVVQFAPNFNEAHALVLKALDLIDDQKVFLSVATLAALRAFGNNDTSEFLFPEPEGVCGHPGAVAHFLNGQSFIGHSRRADSSQLTISSLSYDFRYEHPSNFKFKSKFELGLIRAKERGG